MQDLANATFIHPSAQLYGPVTLGKGSSVWPNSVARAEMNHISVGALTNIQDFVMLHVGYDTPTVIGDFCSITHHVTIHGATIGDDCLIGIGAVVMDGAIIGRGSIVAGGSVIPEGKVYPPNSVIMGSPGKVRAERDSAAANRLNAWMYHRNAVFYARGEHRAWTGPEFETWSAEVAADIEAGTDRDRLAAM